MWNCNDKFDEMCEKYPQLLENLSSFTYENDQNDFILGESFPIDDIKSIKKGLWALFEITLVDAICERNDVKNLLKNVVNFPFFLRNYFY